MYRIIIFVLVVISAYQCGETPAHPQFTKPITDSTTRVPSKYTLTILLAKDSLFYFTEPVGSRKDLKYVPYQKIRDVITDFKQAHRDSIMVLIKVTEGASYKSTVDILDEMTINDIKVYAMTDLTSEEEKLLGYKNK